MVVVQGLQRRLGTGCFWISATSSAFDYEGVSVYRYQSHRNSKIHLKSTAMSQSQTISHFSCSGFRNKKINGLRSYCTQSLCPMNWGALNSIILFIVTISITTKNIVMWRWKSKNPHIRRLSAWPPSRILSIRSILSPLSPQFAFNVILRSSLVTVWWAVFSCPRTSRYSSNLDESQYDQWGPDEIVAWIINLDPKRLRRYEEALSKGLVEDQANTALLAEVDGADLKEWGIVDRKDRKYVKIAIGR